MALKTQYLDAKDPRDFDEAVTILKQGGIGAIPTETVYGLAADALNEAAVARIFEAKGRPPSDPLIVHVQDLESAFRLAHFSEAAQILADEFWPGPLTLIAPRKPVVPDLVTSGLATVALRCPDHPVTRAVLSTSHLALAAPSANPFGSVSPTRAEHVRSTLHGRIDFVLDGGPTGWGLESTILDLSDPLRARLYRPGPISAEALQQKLRQSGFDRVFEDLSQPVGRVNSDASSLPMPAPGLFPRHYAPRTPLSIFSEEDINEEIAAGNARGEYAIVRTGLNKSEPHQSRAHTYLCSEDGSITSAAARFYALLHELDSQGYAKIVVECFPDNDPLLRALNNRLFRAATTPTSS